MGYIYKITNKENGRGYIGQTSRSYKDRWAEHKRDRFKEPYCNWPLYKMINKVGVENVNWEIIEEVPNNLLNEREQYWIEFYNTKDNSLEFCRILSIFKFKCSAKMFRKFKIIT